MSVIQNIIYVYVDAPVNNTTTANTVAQPVKKERMQQMGLHLLTSFITVNVIAYLVVDLIIKKIAVS